MTESETLSTPMDPRAVLAASEALRDEMVAELRALIEIETPSTDPSTMAPAFARLQSLLAASGLESELTPGDRAGGVLVARSSGADGGPYQLLLGHCDTVWPLGTLATMPVEVAGDVLRGPGSFDMKAGLVQLAFALRVLHEAGVRPAVTPVVLINSDEEVGSAESAPEIERLARGADRCYVMEPSLAPDGRLKTRRKGVAQYDVRVKGRAAHAGLNPEEGISAIREMAILVERISDLDDPSRGISVNVGTIRGGMRPNVIAPDCHAVIDVRTPTRADAEEIDGALLGLAPSRPGLEVTVVSKGARPPLEPAAEGRRLWHAARRLAARMGSEIGEGMAGGGSDGNLTNPFTPTLDGLGAVGDGAHSDHEHVRIDRMPERCALLALLLMLPPVARLPGGEEDAR